MTDADARAQLSAAEISVNSPSPTTSLEDVRSETISGIINFKESCGCTVKVTGEELFVCRYLVKNGYTNTIYGS